MSGKSKKAAVVFRLETKNEGAVYFHCTFHELKPCLSKASKVPLVFSMFSTMQALGIFFNILQRVKGNWKRPLLEQTKKDA